MAINIYENDMDGETVRLENKEDLSHLDARFSEHLSAKQKEFFTNYPQSLEKIIDCLEVKAELTSLSHWLKSLLKVKPKLEICTSAWSDPKVWIRFFLRNREEDGRIWFPAIDLADLPDDDVKSCPTILTDVFGAIGKIKLYGLLEAGGLIFPEHNIYWGFNDLSEEAKADREDDKYMVYQTSSGDTFCYNEAGSTFWYDHEVDIARPYSTMNDFLNDLFVFLAKEQEYQRPR